ncbi:hypothetical protein ACJMK2_002307 [Sinanodonta woodiana]|uniref:1-alkyl-2-acetylglycerophosphocholine esterase n=1 Tax=Sinanodonta woodiana TaxID=1069815 RepID=A0ABD3XUZ2_SINWO
MDKKIRRHLPPGSGEYSVGCVDIMNDHTDDGSFFRLYYPVEKTDIFERDTQWPLWLPRKQYIFGYLHFLKWNPKIFGKFFRWIGGDIYVPALWMAPLCQSADQFPVLVFSHGIGGNRTTYTTLCLELASQGFIVASIEHRDGSASMTYHLRDYFGGNLNDYVDSAKKSKKKTLHRSPSFKEEWKPFEHTDVMGIEWDDFQYRNKQVHKRAEECVKVLNVLTALNDGRGIQNFLGFHFNTKQFKGKLDLSKAAMVGHSFGGATCVCALAKDKRFKVGIVLDGWMHPLDEEVIPMVTQPILMLNYASFQWRKNIEQMRQLERQDVERIMITIKGTCHQSCTDFQFLFNKPLGKLLDVRHVLSPKKAMDINFKAVLSFLWKHLGINGKEYHEDVLNGSHKLVLTGTNIDMDVEGGDSPFSPKFYSKLPDDLS